MTRITRAIAAVVIAACALAALHYTVLVPYRCNRALRQISVTTDQAFEDRDDYRASRLAQQNLSALDKLDRACCADPDYYMFKGANLRVLHHYTRAIAVYETALQQAERPEIHAALGIMHVLNGDVEKGLQSMRTGFRFNPYVVDQMLVESPEPAVQAAAAQLRRQP